MKKGSMREDMPATAAFIDALREAFGAAEIDGQIRKGMKGQPTFHASENGHAVGTRLQQGRIRIVYVNGMATAQEINGSGE